MVQQLSYLSSLTSREMGDVIASLGNVYYRIGCRALMPCIKSRIIRNSYSIIFTAFTSTTAITYYLLLFDSSTSIVLTMTTVYHARYERDCALVDSTFPACIFDPTDPILSFWERVASHHHCHYSYSGPRLYHSKGPLIFDLPP